MIPSLAVTPRPDGYVVILRPGDHRKVTHQNRYFVPYDVVLPSGDDHFHICLHPTEEDENRFFAPADAMRVFFYLRAIQPVPGGAKKHVHRNL